MNLGRYLTLAEVTASAKAKSLGIENAPTEAHIENLRALAGAIVDPLRVNLGYPIYISSGYRSDELNTALGPGAARKSQHLEGEAVDIDQDGKGTGVVSNREVFLWIRDNLPFDQLIWEFGDDINPQWVHVSYTQHRKRRGEVLRAAKAASGATNYVRWWGPKGSSGTGRW